MKKPVVFVMLVLAALLMFGVLGCGLLNPTTTTAISTTTEIPTTTTTESPASWLQVRPAGAVPSARSSQAMVYDPTGRRVLMFAGFDGTGKLSETWAYDAAAESWAALNPGDKEQPAAAVQIPAVFDSSTNKVITFDGTTWGYDVNTNTWKALNPKSKLKPVREASCMALDEKSGKAIMFGGTDLHEWYKDTWSYDPVTNAWADLKPGGTVPSGRSDAGMAYDPTSGKIILFGGVDGDFNCLNDTWSYDPAGNAWTKLTAAGAAPSARSGFGMAYDPRSKKIILFGGIDSQFVGCDDTWAFDPVAGTWAQLTPVGSSPTARGRCVLVYSADVDKMVLFGGATVQAGSSGGFGTQVYLNDTWLYGVNLDTSASDSPSDEGAETTSATSSVVGTQTTSTTLPREL